MELRCRRKPLPQNCTFARCSFRNFPLSQSDCLCVALRSTRFARAMLLQERSPMFRKVRIASSIAVFLGSFFHSTLAWGQGGSGLHTRPVVTQSVDETRRVSLEGNTRPEASFRNDRGAVPDATPLDHILLQLK